MPPRRSASRRAGTPPPWEGPAQKAPPSARAASCACTTGRMGAGTPPPSCCTSATAAMARGGAAAVPLAKAFMEVRARATATWATAAATRRIVLDACAPKARARDMRRWCAHTKKEHARKGCRRNAQHGVRKTLRIWRAIDTPIVVLWTQFSMASPQLETALRLVKVGAPLGCVPLDSNGLAFSIDCGSLPISGALPSFASIGR